MRIDSKKNEIIYLIFDFKGRQNPEIGARNHCKKRKLKTSNFESNNVN